MFIITFKLIVCNLFLRTAKAVVKTIALIRTILRLFKRFIKIYGYFLKPFVNAAAVW